MEEHVIIEKLNESINSRKVIAAVFYTFNFDARMFENYVLPSFLPKVNFTDIEIQNTILWRRYANELPPITVYCDFHAKGNEAPTLNYVVRTIDIKSVNGKKACFHPKNSFILLDDWSLLVMTGSNNLSVGGWCTNTEGVSVFELKSGENFPYKLKSEIRDFLKVIPQITDSELTLAELNVLNCLNQRRHTEQTDKRFYSSKALNFERLLNDLMLENDNQPFSRIEIISPYLSTSVDFVKKSLSYSENDAIYCLTPYNATNIAEITEASYTDFENAGLIWSRLIESTNDKIFRFNHAKIYRLKGIEKMFTIVGSANYTQAGWNEKNQGNIESAVVYLEPVIDWKDWLTEYVNPEIQFSVSTSDEISSDVRYDVPDLNFQLDWLDKKLTYQNLKKNYNNKYFSGTINLPGKNYEIGQGKNEIILNDKQLNELAENSIIKVHEYITQREFYFYALNINLECRPYSARLKLNDRELIELWQQVSNKEQDKNEISELLDKILSTRFDNEGEYLGKQFVSKSTLNMIASHINALIKLEERLFVIPTKKGEFDRSKEMIDYYLFANNIDTIAGYRNLLREMLKEDSILPGVAWFLLNLLLMEFYDVSKISKIYAKLESSKEGLRAKIDKFREEIALEIKQIKKTIKQDEISENLYKWVLNQIRK